MYIIHYSTIFLFELFVKTERNWTVQN